MVENIEYVNINKLKEVVTNGHQYVMVYIDAMDIEIPLSRLAVYDKEGGVIQRYLSINGLSLKLGHLFTPINVFGNYWLIHWCFDEKKIDGATEQDLLKALLSGYGYINIRDIDSNGINDTEIEDLNFTDAFKLDHKYFGFFSMREVKYLMNYANSLKN